VLLRASTFVKGVSGVAESRANMGAKAVQVVNAGRMFWSSKPTFFRNAPHTIENPHLGQIETRLTFADIASRAKGCRGFEDGLPCVAARIKREMEGYRAADRLPEEEYPSKVKRTVHTAEELRKMLEEVARRRAGATAGRF